MIKIIEFIEQEVNKFLPILNDKSTIMFSKNGNNLLNCLFHFINI